MTAARKHEVRTRLRSLSPTAAGADMLGAFQRAVDADPAKEDARRIIVFLTDGQSHGWRTGVADAWEALARSTADLAQRRAAAVLAAQGESDEIDNLSLESVAVSRRLVGAGENVTLTASVRNTGTGPSEPAVVAWRCGDQAAGLTALPVLEAGQSTTVSIRHAFVNTGVIPVSCEIRHPDALDMDNVGRFAVEVVDAARILVVDGSHGAGPAETETGYLLAALGGDERNGGSGWESAFRARVIAASALGSETLSDYGCVVLANVPALSEETAKTLAAFVRRGGGLWVALGDLTSRSFFNETLSAAASGLSPVALAGVVGNPGGRGWSMPLYPPPENHPATRLLSDTQRLDIDRVRVYAHHRLEAVEDAEGLSVLLKTPEGQPLAVEKGLGRGRIIIQAFPLSLEWSNLPLCQSFVVLVHEWLWYLIEPAANRWNLERGEGLVLSLPADAWEAEGNLVPPAGAPVHIKGAVRDEQVMFVWADTFQPGEYVLSIRDRAGELHPHLFEVGRDARESDLAPLSKAEIETLGTAAGISFAGDPLATGAGGGQAPTPKPIWPWLLALVVALMGAELWLTGRFSAKRRAPVAVPEGIAARPERPAAAR